MLDIKFIRENSDLVKNAVKVKKLESTVDIDEILKLDRNYAEILKRVEDHRGLKNELSNTISKLTGEEKEKLISEATGVKNELGILEAKLKELRIKLNEMLLWVPNPPATDVPVGNGEEDNIVVRKEGRIPTFDFKVSDHLDLGINLGIINTGRGAKIGGFRGYFLKNDGVELEKALLNYATDFIRSKGFDFFTVPWTVKPQYLVGTGYFPWGEEDHYKNQDGMVLIGTAEVSLTSYYAGEVLEEKDLPIKLAGISPCFRREVGSYGKDTRGIFRVHQFTKVEQVVLLPEGEELSREWHEKMLGHAEELLKNLELPYQILLMCSADMGAGQRKKYDIETWFPFQNKYRETHSDSYFLDFQSRRLNIKYRNSNGKLRYVSTLNNTVVATPRLLATVLENYQQKDGSVKVPKVLQKYIGKKVIKAVSN